MLCSPIIKSSEIYLRVFFFLRMGWRLNLKKPSTFNEKLQWLKLYGYKPIYTQMVDKYGVRELVAERIGEDKLIPLLGVWSSFDEIDFDKLPNQFVLKATHDSGSVVICKDKNNFDIEKAQKKLTSALKYNYFWKGREMPYRDVQPRIICEQYMADLADVGLMDYKFFVFNGEAKLIFVVSDRFSQEGAKFDYLDLDFNSLDFGSFGHNRAGDKLQKPDNWEEMKLLIKKLAFDDIPFVRIDLYSIKDKIYFGEYTFFHDGGVVAFEPKEWDRKLGDMINL